MSTAPGIKTAAAALEALLDLPRMVEAMRAELVGLRGDVEGLRKLVPPQLVTVAEAARVMKVSTKTIRRQVAAGTLRAVRVGDHIRVDLSEIQSALSR